MSCHSFRIASPGKGALGVRIRRVGDVTRRGLYLVGCDMASIGCRNGVSIIPCVGKSIGRRGSGFGRGV